MSNAENSNSTETVTLPNGLLLVDGRVRCPDCDRWEHASKGLDGSAIRHDRVRCDFKPTPVAKVAPVQESRREAVARGEWTKAAEVTNEFGNGSKGQRVGLDTDY